MEERKVVRNIKVDYKCPKCEIGYLIPTGNVLTTYPPQFPHKCNNLQCDYGQTFSDKTYPYIDHEEIPVENVINPLTTDQQYEKMAQELNYTNLCARATLFPGKSIDEIPVYTGTDMKQRFIDMQQKIVDIDNSDPMIDIKS